MKKLIITSLLAFCSVILLHSQTSWTNNGSNIYYNGGNVGIGISSPTYKLHVVGNANITTLYTISLGVGGAVAPQAPL